MFKTLFRLKSLDHIKLPIPIYIDQLFSNIKQSIKLDLDCNLSKITIKLKLIFWRLNTLL